MLLIESLLAGRGRTAISRLPALRVGAGQTALLIGPSGAGKTTTLLAIAGLAPTFGGQVTVDGVEVTTLKPRVRDAWRGRNLGFVFQDLHLIAGLSALDNLLLSPFAAGLPQEPARARALLEEMGLATRLNRPAETLSRGEAQRAAIARAMLIRPKLILADEPTASLDDEACQAVWGLLQRAAEETGAALLVATHDRRLRDLVALQARVEPLS